MRFNSALINFYLLRKEFFFLYFFLFKAMEKLKRQLAEAEAAVEARKKPPEDSGPRIIGEGLVIDEWVSQIFQYLL